MCLCIANATQKLEAAAAATAEVLNHMLKANPLLEVQIEAHAQSE